MGTISNSEPMVVWVEGSDKRKPTNGLVLKSFYDNETDQWVSPNDRRLSKSVNVRAVKLLGYVRATLP